MDFSQVDAVVFDFGGVVALPPPKDWPLYGLIAEIGLSREALKDGFSRWRLAWDGDTISGEEMYAHILDENGIAHTPELLARLKRADAEGWVMAPNPRTLQLAKDLKAAGKKIGLLTNMSTDFFEDYFAPRFGAFRALLDAEVVSGPERVCKPDPRIYRLMEARLGVPAARILFFDDLERNVLGARACGWQAEVYA